MEWGTDRVSDLMVEAMIAAEARAMVANVDTHLSAMTVAGRLMPVTRNDGGHGASYVCQPHSAYVLYAREELELVRAGWIAAPARLGLDGLDRLLRGARINRIVHLANWMLSTNLHDGWRGEGVKEAREALIHAWPDHIIGIRSVDDWSSPGLREALMADGWILVPSRQIWVVDDMRRQWRERHNHANDRRLIARTPLRIRDVGTLSPACADRIATLYRMLYIDRYSALNPVLTPDFIRASAASGMIRYRAAFDPEGEMRAVAGMWVRDGIMTPSVVGYDIHRPQGEGLYRVASWMFMDAALEAGWRLHGSAGAAHFKRGRGAEGVIEYNAYFARHLSRGRRLALETLAALLHRIALPLMVKRQW